MKRLRVLGASGVAGRAFVPQAAAAGHEVLTDRIDILDIDALRRGLRGVDAVVNLASAIPRPGGRGDWATNDRIRRQGTAHLLAVCAEAGVRCLVQQSVAMLHHVADDRPQHEDDPIDGGGVLASALDMERLLRAAALDVRIVRGGLFYGGASGVPERWLAQVRAARHRLPGDGSGWVSPVHVDDHARALLVVLGLPPAGPGPRAFIACDDVPLRWREVYARAAAAARERVPAAGGPVALPSFRTSNARLRALGWAPRHSLLMHIGVTPLPAAPPPASNPLPSREDTP
ncbi:MAG TPA: NAD(P)-dependent oxidoreductase [Burkholderiaceae bacterium]|nr:NAD(P)-dependent oxidoreductase [Burkholderiaceae bacterium]